MLNISDKTLVDLEFDQIKLRIQKLCSSTIATDLLDELRPYDDFEQLNIELARTQEYLSSYESENRIPNHNFEDISEHIKLLAIENTFLEEKAYLNIASISDTCNELVKFFEKYKDYYPRLHENSQIIYYTKDITEAVYTVFNRHGEVKDNATKILNELRKKKNLIKRDLDQSFVKAMNHYSKMGILDEIRESVVENKRVLAIVASERKKVKGNILGSSRTGSIVFIEPDSTQNLHRELASVEFEEKEEIIRILKLLTDLLRPHRELLKNYLTFLGYLDFVRAKVNYGRSINACLPKTNQDYILDIKDAYHPILLENNNQSKQITVPQSFYLDQDQRIIVISGPNAGGKSITLKTLGLNQIMLQSGMLIPVHESSSLCFFDKVFSDIGDNQSIENHLSTYSYRLKNMRTFLRNINHKSLFLIDEFGTGSDPELGGALAEVFLEEFYQKGAYGIVTTHYTNIKVMVDQMDNAVNANMMFDEKTLEPIFKLNIGQAGSSFTFEVAQKNGIPYSLINRAKKKVRTENVRLDKTIAKLQKERSKLEKTNTELNIKEIQATEQKQKFELINDKIAQKLEDYQIQFDSQAKHIYLGKKLKQIADLYFQKPNKKMLFNETLKLVEVENAKKREKLENSKLDKKKAQAEEKRLEKIAAEMEQKAQKIREEKAKNSEKIKAVKEAEKYQAKLGDIARIKGGMASGSIEKISKGKAVINYGSFLSTVPLDELEFVRAGKK